MANFNLGEDVKIKELREKVKHFVMILSGKGGVGKTTVSVNLSTALAENGFKVGLLDLDIHGPDVVRMLGKDIYPGMDQENEKIIPAESLPNLKVLSISMLVEEGKPIVWRGPLKHTAIKQFLTDTAWGELDYLIFDMPPGTGDEALSLIQTLGKIDGAIIITTPQKVALDDVRRALSFVESMNQKTLGLVENMSYMRCKDEIIYPFGKGGADILSKEYNIPVLGKIPFDPKALELLDEGKPITLYYRESEVEESFRKLAENLVKEIEK